MRLQGGSGGGIEIGAVGSGSIAGAVLANGGAGGSTFSNGGGGAGGGIFIHAQTVALSGALNAVGGAGGIEGGGGGGGRVHILTTTGTLASGSLDTNVNVSRGDGNSPGGNGVKELSPTQLAFAQQPVNSTSVSLAAVTVRVLDARGNLVNTSTAPITLALGNNPGGATLGGTLTVNAVGGLATISNLTINRPGTGYTLVASSGVFTSATSNAFNLTCPPLTVTPATGALTAGTTGSAYSQLFTQTGGTGTITWNINPPVPGLSLSANGLLSGTPTQSGNFSFTVTASTATGCSGATSYTLMINCATVDVPPTDLPSGLYGNTYGAEFIPTGGTAPYQFVVTGLPSGMTATAGSVILTLGGAPTQTGTFNVVVRVTDGYGCGNGAGRTYTLTINRVSPTIFWNNPAGITYGTPLRATQLNATANVPGSFAYTPASGTVLNAGNGQTLSVTFTPTDTTNYTNATRTVTINVAKAPLTVTAENKTKVGGAAVPPLTYAVTGFVNGQNATVLSGAPTLTTTATASSNVGNYPINITQGTLSAANYSFNLVAGVLSVTCPTTTSTLPGALANGTVGTAYNASVAAAPSDAYVYSFTGTLPPGVSLNTATGALTGTPGSAGTFGFTVMATRYGSCAASQAYTVSIACPALVEVLPKPTGPLPTAAFALPAARAGQSYTTPISANPAGGSYSFSVIASPNQLPAGLMLNSSTGVISGTTNVTGNYVFRIQATPAGGCAAASRLYSLRVNP